MKPMNDDPFMRRIAARPLPNKLEINNTPIRQRDLPMANKQNQQIFAHNRSNPKNVHELTPENPINPYQIGNSRTIPKRKVSTVNAVSRACVNHGQVQAQFRIEIDRESLNYCGKCAAHLASNGFKVQRISCSTSRSPRRIKQTIKPTNVKRKQELTAFLQTLGTLQADYTATSQKLSKVQSSHFIQKQTISNFYSSLLEYLEYIRDEHLNFLDMEAKRNTQICQIQSSQIEQTLEEITAMREDIESNVDKIVEQVDEESYGECMNYYHQKKGVHQHRLEELGNDARPANCTSGECVEQKLNQFKYFIDELTGILSSKVESVEY